jgi:integrase
MAQNYVTGNPFAGATLPRASSRQLGSGRSLTFEQWDFISAELDKDVGKQNELQRRRARAIRWLYATGLGLAEIGNARCGDLHSRRYVNADGKKAIGWTLKVIGKGEKERVVPVPPDLVDDLSKELVRWGLDPRPTAAGNADVAILAKFTAIAGAVPQAWSSSGLYKSIRAFMKACALQLDDEDAAHDLQASTHWLRHSHASHALNGRDGHLPVPLEVVRNNMGHSSMATTSGYLTGEQDARLRAMEGFWGKAKA